MQLHPIITLSALLFFTLPAYAETPLPAVATPTAEPSAELLSIREEMKLAIQRGNRFLQSTQKEEGYWYDSNLPAFTALATYAAMTDPNKAQGHTPKHIKKAYSFLLSKVHKDGGIYGKGLHNYNTSLSVMALASSGDPEHVQTIINARHFLINLQTNHKPGLDGKPNIMNGGIGYGGSYPHSDMSNSHLAIQAIRTADAFAKDSGSPAANVDLDWEAAMQFISSCQNLESTNPSPETGNDGSFVYFPGNSKAGYETSKEGKETLKGYGSMSYAGLLSFIYADLDENDQRVVAVKSWLNANYTLKENPGLGQQGLYYYYHTMAKALSAANIQTLKLKDGTHINWRKELASKILQSQRENGSWTNENSRWLESEPDLVTSYAILTLNQIYLSIPKTQ